jgi:transposase
MQHDNNVPGGADTRPDRRRGASPSSPPRCRTVAEHGSQLPEVDGIGPVAATRLLGSTGRASRFPTSSAFAAYSGVAPVEVASGDRARQRLPRGGDRQLKLALHIVALTQVHMRASPGRAYYDHKIAEGKTHTRPCAASSAGWPTTSGASWSPTSGERHQRRAREDIRGRL